LTAVASNDRLSSPGPVEGESDSYRVFALPSWKSFEISLVDDSVELSRRGLPSFDGPDLRSDATQAPDPARVYLQRGFLPSNIGEAVLLRISTRSIEVAYPDRGSVHTIRAADNARRAKPVVKVGPRSKAIYVATKSKLRRYWRLPGSCL
jgi:hypothetical protein